MQVTSRFSATYQFGRLPKYLSNKDGLKQIANEPGAYRAEPSKVPFQ
jgi:hypothetical protein